MTHDLGNDTKFYKMLFCVLGRKKIVYIYINMKNSFFKKENVLIFVGQT